MQARKGVLAWTGAVAAIVLLALILFWSDLTGKADPTTTPTPSGTTNATATTPTSPASSATPTPDARSQAVAQAEARYRSAMAAADRAGHDPRRIDMKALVAAGNTDPWLADIINDLVFDRDNGYYSTGSVQILSMRATRVVLTGEQPSIRLDVCADTSKIQPILRSTGKPAPDGPGDIDRPHFTAEMVKTAVPGVNGGKSTWFLKSNKVVGKC